MLVAAGFAAEDVDILAGIAADQLATAKAAAAKKAAAANVAGSKHLAVAQVERLVRAGQQTIADYQAALVAAGYDAESVTALVNLLQLQLDQDSHLAAASGRSSALLTTGGWGLGQVRSAVKLGIVDIAAYDAALTAAGVSAAVAATGTTLDALEQQVYAGTLTPVAFGAALSAAGVSSPDVAAFVELVTERSATQGAVQQLEAAVSATAAAKGLSLGDFKAAVKAGVQTIDQYQAFVTSLGYGPADTAILVATEAKDLGITPPALPALPTGA